MKSTSVVFTGPQQCELREEELGDPGAGQIQVQTLVSLMSIGTESWCYRGEFDADTGWANWVKHPFYPGYSNVAKVIKVGAGVTELAEGDRVFSTSNHKQFLNLGADSPSLIKLRDGLDEESASWSKLATITQTGVRHAAHAMGHVAAVVGLGPIGQLVTQYLRVMGARDVLAIDTAQHRLDAALAHGATHAFCGGAGDAKPFVEEHTEGNLADVVYDATGHYAVFPLAQALVKNFGTLLLIGDSPHPSRQHLTQDVLTRQLRICGTHNEKLPPAQEWWTPKRQMQLFHTYLLRGQMRTADLITHRFRAADAPQVYADLQRDRSEVIGAMFDWR